MTAHPRLPGALAAGDTLADAPESWQVDATEVVYESGYLDLTVDTIVGPGDERMRRVVARPRGAVAVAALDDHDRLLLVQQYRHPVGLSLLELPAGTLDVDGESPRAAVARELAEEGDVVAEHWTQLLQLATSAGFSSEIMTVYEASGLSPVPEDQRTVREAEEAGMRQWWIALDEAAAAVLDGRIIDAKTVAAVLALRARRS